MRIETGTCGCGETETLYGGSCYECCQAATGGNFAEELLAYEQGEGQEERAREAEIEASRARTALLTAAIESGRLTFISC
jgi:hypothetical protein